MKILYLACLNNDPVIQSLFGPKCAPVWWKASYDRCPQFPTGASEPGCSDRGIILRKEQEEEQQTVQPGTTAPREGGQKAKKCLRPHARTCAHQISSNRVCGFLKCCHTTGSHYCCTAQDSLNGDQLAAQFKSYLDKCV